MKRAATIAYPQMGGPLPAAGGQVRMARVMRKPKSSVLVPLFIFSLALPIFFYVGPTRMSPYRLVLVVMFIPCLVTWLSGSLGRIRLADILMLLTALWGGMILLWMHGTDKGLQSGGIFVIETFGAFLIGRRYIRDFFAFQKMVKVLVLVVIGLLPFAIYENVMGYPILITILGKVFLVYDVVDHELRLGLRRAQGPFEHFILFGVVSSSAFGLAFYVFGLGARFRGTLAAGLVAMTVISSLSSGAILSVAIQLMLIAWDKITTRMARRWAILISILVSGFLVVNFISNRTTFEVFITYLTFNADTSYMRILIWRYGSESVMLSPIFGHGLNDWERPGWMGGSIDNFWLVNAVRYGIPGFLLSASSFLAVCIGLGRLKNLPFEVAQCRMGLVVTICGLAISLCTVHVWDAPYVLIIFLLGSGMWMFDAPKASAPQNCRIAVRRGGIPL